jgi:DNA-binding transcriptional LysR family regulator
LARGGLIERYLSGGRLVRPLEGGLATDVGFFVVWRAGSRKLGRIQALRDWLIAEVETRRNEAE